MPMDIASMFVGGYLGRGLTSLGSTGIKAKAIDKLAGKKALTKLIGKEEVFNTLALGEALQLPVLLLGLPGTGKTQALLDYAASKYNYNREQVKENTFVIELDEGTKSSEIKGRVNMKNLLEISNIK